MKKVYQTIFDPDNGNCFSACLASILEVPLESVPNFHQMYDKGYMSHVIPWLADRGYSMIVIRGGNINGRPVMMGTQGMHIIAGYVFEDDPRKHAVVCKVDATNPFGVSIVHDPAEGVGKPIDDTKNPGPWYLIIITPTRPSKYSGWVNHLKEAKANKEYKGHPELRADIKPDVRPFEWKAPQLMFKVKSEDITWDSEDLVFDTEGPDEV